MGDDVPGRAVAPAIAAAAEHIGRAATIWLGTHVDPDGDAIGSLLGLGHVLRAAGKTVVCACQDRPPREAAGLPGADTIVHAPPDAVDLAIALDAADTRRLGRLYTPEAWARQPTVVVDHHVSNPGFGDVDVIDPAAASTAELLLDLIDALGAPVSAAAAECLLTGIVTDTLGFRTSSTTPRSLAAAQRLMGAGASLAEVCQRAFFNQPLATLRLTGRVLDTLTVDGPFVVAQIARADMARFGVSAGDTSDITRLLQSAAEPVAVAFVRERADGDVDVSLRSHPGVDVGPAAAALGGGGHPQAAGARISGPLEAAVAAVRDALHAHVRLPDGRGAP